MDIIWNVIKVAVVCVGVFVLVDMYLRWARKRWFPVGLFPEPLSGIDATGELTMGAKYALWSYMFRILGVGGTIISIVAGIAGYMINDLAKQNAIHEALNGIQKPLEEQLEKFADAKAALKATLASVTTKEFNAEVADKVATDEIFRAGVAAKISNDEAFRTKIAAVLVANYRDQLRGDKGPQGEKGKDGINGTSPSAASVAEALNDAAFRAEVAKVLVANYKEPLRGDKGPQGEKGKDGVNGTSPSATSVAEALNDATFRVEVANVLVAKYKEQLRGPPGPGGLAGKDGVSPSADEVAAILVSKYPDKLRQILAPARRRRR